MRLPDGVQLDDISWDAEAFRTLVIEMLARSDASPADLLRAWDGRNGLTREAFTYYVRESFFEGQSDADLWTHEVAPVVESAFNAISDTVPGENFLQTVGIVHFDRWFGAATLLPNASTPMYTMETLPLKTRDERRRQRARRRARDRAEHNSRARAERVASMDWVAAAKADIDAAAATAAARERERVLATVAKQLASQRERRRLPSLPQCLREHANVVHGGEDRWPLPQLFAVSSAPQAPQALEQMRAARAAGSASSRGAAHVPMPACATPGEARSPPRVPCSAHSARQRPGSSRAISPRGMISTPRSGAPTGAGATTRTQGASPPRPSRSACSQQRKLFLAHIRSVRQELDFAVGSWMLGNREPLYP